jgi:peptidoglycan/LPS O-acetylase OafA/YrhL
MEENPKLQEELQKMEYEPLLPIEKKLIAWSIFLGLVLIVILCWISHTFFEV